MARDNEPEATAGPLQGGQGGPKLARRDILVGAGLLVATGIAYARMPHTPDIVLGKSKLENLVPKTFGKWQFQTTSGLVVPPSDQLADKIYSQLLTRQYSGPNGATVMLLIAYSGMQDGVIQVHRPEVCYPASGYKLIENSGHDVRLSDSVDIATRFIVAERELQREQLMYWTRLGHYFPSTWADQRIAVIRENLAGIIPDGVLVRFSSVADGDAHAVLDGFAADLYRSVGPVMKQVMAGAAAVAGPR